MKKLFIVGLLVFLLSCCGLATIFVVNGFDLKSLSLDKQVFEDKTYKSLESFNKVNVEFDDTELKITNSSDENLYILYKESQYISFDIKIENNTLFIKENDTRNFIDEIFCFNFQSPSMEIKLPNTFNGEIDVDLDNGDMKLENFTSTTLKIESDNSCITINNVVVANTLELENNNGSVNFNNCNFNKVNASTRNGSIKFTSLVSSFITFETRNGEIEGTILGNETEYNFNISTRSNSNVNSKAGTTSKTINAKTHNGEINIYFK